jgi:hypothetical protein
MTVKFDNQVRKAKVIRIVNGNTLDLEVNLGFGITALKRVDLARVSHCDQFTEVGQKARVSMGREFHFVKDVTVQFDKHPEDSSRFIGEVWMDDGRNVSDYLLTNGFASPDDERRVNVLG